jgi:aspartate carbamoyltransferase catalytic subunit
MKPFARNRRRSFSGSSDVRMPRMDEIPLDVDTTRWSRYWQEAFNDVVMRMALLALVLGAVE